VVSLVILHHKGSGIKHARMAKKQAAQWFLRITVNAVQRAVDDFMLGMLHYKAFLQKPDDNREKSSRLLKV
jgi:hypothetical protein